MFHWTANLAVHAAFETIGYAAGAAVYVFVRKSRGDAVKDEHRAAVFAGAAVGALLGSRVLYWLCDPASNSLLGGKTIAGGLLGGLIGVELAKKVLGVTQSTGDLLVLPLITAMSIGRIGCFLAGPLDQTAGNPTSLPWAIAIGDGVPRHPVALYEIAFLLLLIPITEFVRRRSSHAGDAFAVFLASYLLFRLSVDFIKPDPPRSFFALSAIQWACVGGLIYYALIFTNDERSTPLRLLRRRRLDLPDVLPQD